MLGKSRLTGFWYNKPGVIIPCLCSFYKDGGDNLTEKFSR